MKGDEGDQVSHFFPPLQRTDLVQKQRPGRSAQFHATFEGAPEDIPDRGEPPGPLHLVNRGFLGFEAITEENTFRSSDYPEVATTV